MSYTEIGIIYATREIVVNFSEFPTGLVADTYGRKNALIAAFLAYILSFIIFYLSSDFTYFIVAMILYGIADAFRSGTHKGMIMDYLRIKDWEDQKVSYYGHTRSWSQMGSAISALVAGFLVLYFGSYRNVFLFSIIPYVLNFFNIASYPRELNFSAKEDGTMLVQGLRETVITFFSVIKKPKVFPIINTTALHSAFLDAIKDYIQPLMLSVALMIPITFASDDTKQGGLVIGILYSIIFILTSYASKNAHKFDRLHLKNISRLTLLTGFLSALICGIFYRQELWIPALIAFVFIYVLENIRKPILTGAISDNVPNSILTSVISAQSFYQTILTSGLALSLGILADKFEIGAAFIMLSIALIFFTIITGTLKFKLKQVNYSQR